MLVIVGLLVDMMKEYRGTIRTTNTGCASYAVTLTTVLALCPAVGSATPNDGSGIASRYSGDTNIASDPAVIFADDFESYTSPSQLTTRWDGAGPLANLRIATEPGNFFSGGKALEMKLPISATEVVNEVRKRLSPEEVVVYIRAYTKFDPGYSVTGSNHNGLRLSAHYPAGAGRRPPPDGTGFFLFSVQNNIQGNGRPGEVMPGYSHIYAYWPHQRSEFGDHWYSDGWVAPFGNGDWLLYPSQYPDFRPMPNWQPQRDRWYCYELMVKANTVGNNDGEVAYWIDGNLTGRFPNLFLRSIDTLKIDDVELRLHAQHSERINKKWYDNVVIATQYIGPMVSATTARGDFNSDGKPDYVLYNGGTHQTVVWYMNNNVFAGGALGPTLPAGWRLADVADFNRNGKTDYALFNPSTHRTAIYYLAGPALVSSAFGPTIPSGYELIGVADFNVDGKPDYVLYNASTRRTAVWYLNNNVYAGGAYGPILPAGWRLAGVADFNRDGKSDYLLFNPSTRQSAIWYLSGVTVVGGAFGPTIASGYELTGTADFNGNGSPDYVLYNSSTRRTAIWYLNNNTFTSGAWGPILPAGWSLVAP
jgi:hypothetical protein